MSISAVVVVEYYGEVGIGFVAVGVVVVCCSIVSRRLLADFVVRCDRRA